MNETDGPSEEYLVRARKRMARIDAMSAQMRELVHEYGLTIVDAFVQCGVKNPRHIRHLIQTVTDQTPYGNSRPPRDGA